MKRQLLAIALGSLFALPALANNEIDAGAAGTTYSANNAGLVFADAEQGYVPLPESFKARLTESINAIA